MRLEDESAHGVHSRQRLHNTSDQSTINQESLLPWLTSVNSSSLTTIGHNMTAMLFVPKTAKSLARRKEGSAVGRQSALAVIY
ncbi:hypothetical protein PoB_006064700 [Plakobranchus ocellatus]|uniref:Uncharacterized protein n=1 Tax=Plakobranchus ocellatus TaxID=259542 RepID=A0AAV4CQI6_9GAST|nr:hypothetical protein PoB_006064700 [Plakobranchus ocellatus]